MELGNKSEQTRKNIQDNSEIDPTYKNTNINNTKISNIKKINKKDLAQSEKPKRACQLPDDFKPNDHHQEIAQAENINLESEFIKFKDYCLANGKKYIDWDAGFNNWLRNAGKFSKQKTPQKQPFMTRSERNMAVLNSMRG